jgi:hypothetical protein
LSVAGSAREVRGCQLVYLCTVADDSGVRGREPRERRATRSGRPLDGGEAVQRLLGKAHRAEVLRPSVLQEAKSGIEHVWVLSFARFASRLAINAANQLAQAT